MPMFKPLVLHKTKILCVSGKDSPGGSHSRGLGQRVGVHLALSFSSCLVCIHLARHQTWLLKCAFNLSLLHIIQ